MNFGLESLGMFFFLLIFFLQILANLNLANVFVLFYKGSWFYIFKKVFCVWLCLDVYFIWFFLFIKCEDLETAWIFELFKRGIWSYVAGRWFFLCPCWHVCHIFFRPLNLIVTVAASKNCADSGINEMQMRLPF